MCQSLLSDSWNKGGLGGDGGSREEKEPGRQMERGRKEGEMAAGVCCCVSVCVCTCQSLCVLSQ